MKEKDIYNIYLPSKKSEWFPRYVNINSICNSMFIVGANGSGKTQLGVKIAEENKAHRISAQKLLTFNNNISVKNLEVAINELLYGTEGNPNNIDKYAYNKQKHTSIKSKRFIFYNKDDTNATALLNDFDKALTAFMSKLYNKNEQYKNSSSEFKDIIMPKNIEKIFGKIWNIVFSHGSISFKDFKVKVHFNRDDEDLEPCDGSKMSDGERVALYFLVLVLSLPDNKKIIIDEPEMHLHPSIMNKLWSALEEARPDCLFIYITHDMDFVASHQLSTKIWVKNYDGVNWEWEEIKKDELPEKLKLEILGSKKPVLFIEGDKNSYDYEIYSLIYNDYYIVPCGGCEEVKKLTKAFNNSYNLHNYKCYGIVDRDYKTDQDIEKLGKSYVFVLQVAEIENLFLVPEMLEVVSEIIGFKEKKQIDEVKNYIINERFLNEIEQQILNALINKIKTRLEALDISGKTPEEVKNRIDGSNEFLDFDNTKKYIESLYKNNLEKKDYKEIIKIYNQKNLCKSKEIGDLFGLENKSYVDFVLQQLKNKNKDKILKAILPYLPTNEQIPYKTNSTNSENNGS